MKMIAGLALIGVLLSTAACGSDEPEKVDPIEHGIVVERSRRLVVVLEADGERERHSIHKRSRKCQVDEYWPNCLDGYAPKAS